MTATALRFGPATLTVRDDLSPRDALFVPKWDESIESSPDLERAIALGADMDMPVLIVGPTGCGKTRTLLNMAAALNQPIRRVNLFGDIRSSDLLGEKSIEIDPETNEAIVVWRDGVITDCKRNGYWLLLDEFDACPASIAMTLQSLLEPDHPLLLTGNAGELVEPERPGFRIFATANTLGRGDTTGLYAGTNMMNEATLDRFFVTRASYLDPKEETKVIAKLGLPEAVASKMVWVAHMTRAGFEKEECTSTFSTRRLVAWAKVAARFARGGTPTDAHMTMAYAMTVGHKLAKEDAEYFAGVVQRVMSLKVRD